MSKPSTPCIFCNPGREILAENAPAIAEFDSFPVAPGHALVLPRRHAETIWDLEDASTTVASGWCGR